MVSVCGSGKGLELLLNNAVVADDEEMIDALFLDCHGQFFAIMPENRIFGEGGYTAVAFHNLPD